MFEGLPRGKDKPLLPAPREKGWANVPITCEWACKWLRSLLMKGDGSFDFGSFGTHSCKRTVLTWLSVMGIDRPTRSLLNRACPVELLKTNLWEGGGGKLRCIDSEKGKLEHLNFLQFDLVTVFVFELSLEDCFSFLHSVHVSPVCSVLIPLSMQC